MITCGTLQTTKMTSNTITIWYRLELLWNLTFCLLMLLSVDANSLLCLRTTLNIIQLQTIRMIVVMLNTVKKFAAVTCEWYQMSIGYATPIINASMTNTHMEWLYAILKLHTARIYTGSKWLQSDRDLPMLRIWKRVMWVPSAILQWVGTILHSFEMGCQMPLKHTLPIESCLVYLGAKHYHTCIPEQHSIGCVMSSLSPMQSKLDRSEGWRQLKERMEWKSAIVLQLSANSWQWLGVIWKLHCVCKWITSKANTFKFLKPQL